MRKIICILLAMLALNVGQAQKTYIWCGKLITSKDLSVQNEMTLIVENGKLLEVVKGYTRPPAGAISIDMQKATVMPGWIDMQVHLEFETYPDAYIQAFTSNPADIAYQSIRFADNQQ